MLKLTAHLNIIFSNIPTEFNKIDFKPYYETRFNIHKSNKAIIKLPSFFVAVFWGTNETTHSLAEITRISNRKHGCQG